MNIYLKYIEITYFLKFKPVEAEKILRNTFAILILVIGFRKILL